MFENLSERLERSFKILKGEGKITEINISETLKDVRRALLDADVSYKVAKEFCDRVKTKALGANVLTAVKPQQMMVKIVHDELAEFMGSTDSSLNLKGNPAVVLVCGLNGSGKTTFSAKLALLLKVKKGQKVLLAACDCFRPAAVEQLKTLGAQTGVPVFSIDGETDPLAVAGAALSKARSEGFGVVIVDTAGRLTVDAELMDEIRRMHAAVTPSETLFVVDAMTGQDAVASALASMRQWIMTAWCSPRWTATPAEAPLSPSARSRANPSNTSAPERRWRLWTSSILRVWPTGYSVWAMSSLSWRRLRSSTTRPHPVR